MKHVALFALIIGSMSWVVGSLYAKYKKTTAPASVNTSWQMFFAGLYFFTGAGLTGEFKNFHLSTVSCGRLVLHCPIWSYLVPLSLTVVLYG